MLHFFYKQGASDTKQKAAFQIDNHLSLFVLFSILLIPYISNILNRCVTTVSYINLYIFTNNMYNTQIRDGEATIYPT